LPWALYQAQCYPARSTRRRREDVMKVRLIAYEGNRQQLKDFALLLEPETEFEDDLIKAILNKAEADVSIIAQDGKIGILIKRGVEIWYESIKEQDE